jgi:hypothetical protein
MQTACRINSISSAGLVVSNDLWLRDNRGCRFQWLVDDLTPSTNHTAYVIQDQAKLSGPIYFTTEYHASLLGVVYVRLCHRISTIPLLPCALPSILSVYIIRCSSSLPSIPCIILRLFRSPTELRPCRARKTVPHAPSDRVPRVRENISYYSFRPDTQLSKAQLIQRQRSLTLWCCFTRH